MSPAPADAPADLVRALRAAGCVFAEEEAALLVQAADGAARAALLARRVAGEPLEHVLGWAWFDGGRVPVDAGVFVPRRRSELLVREAERLVLRGDVVVDLCCGSGALGLALARRVDVEVHATDVDPAAVRSAQRALAPVGGTAYQGDLTDPLPTNLRGRVRVILANTPYVPTAGLVHLPPEARLHEPALALDGGADGLDVARRVVASAPAWLTPGGSVLIETSTAQAEPLAAVMAEAGLVPRAVTDPTLGATAVVGTLPG